MEQKRKYKQDPKIAIRQSTKEKLNQIGTKGFTYDQIINFLINNYTEQHPEPIPTSIISTDIQSIDTQNTNTQNTDTQNISASTKPQITNQDNSRVSNDDKAP